MEFIQFLGALIVFEILKYLRLKIIESNLVFKLKKKIRLYRKK